MRAQGEFAQVKERIENALGKEGQPVGWGTMAHDHDVYMLLVEAAAELGEKDALKKYSRLLEVLARRDRHRLYLGIALRGKGVLHRLNGEYEEGRNQLEEAREIFEALGTRWQLGKTLSELGRLSHDVQDHPAARNFFNQAIVEFEALGAMPEIERNRTEQENLV